MLKALQQLNSQPIVVLTRLQSVEEQLKKQFTKPKVSEQNDSRCSNVEHSQASEITVSQPILQRNKGALSVKRKATLEDVLSEADAVYFKKFKKSIKDADISENCLKGSAKASRKSKTEKSVLKVNLFKSYNKNQTQTDSGSAKTKNRKEKQSKKNCSKEKQEALLQEATSVIKRRSDSLPPTTCIPILAYLELVPRPDEQTDDELAALTENTTLSSLPQVEGDIARSDSVETVALEDLKETSRSETRMIECVNLISPSPSPTSTNVDQVEFGDSQDGPRGTQLIQMFKEEDPSIQSTSRAMDSVEKHLPCTEETTVRNAPGEKSAENISAASAKSKSSSNITHTGFARENTEERTNINETFTNGIHISPGQVSNVANEQGTDKPLTANLDGCQGEDSNILLGEKNIFSNVTSTDCKGTCMTEPQPIKEVFGVQSSDPSLDQLKADFIVQSTRKGYELESDKHAAKTVLESEDKSITTEILMNSVSRDGSVNAMFNEAFQICSTMSSRECSDGRSKRIQPISWESRKLAVIHELSELKKIFQQNIETVKPQEHSLRMKIFHYDSVKAEIQTKEKENGEMAAQVVNLSSACETLQNKCMNLAVEKKNSQQESLETQIRLREQQAELCRKQLLEGVSQLLDESHPAFHVMRETQEAVEKLEKEVADKSATCRAIEETFTQSELDLKKTQKELQALLNRQEERKRVCEKLSKQLELLKKQILEMAAAGEQTFEKQRELWLKGLSLREELVKIDSLERLEEIHKRREQANNQRYTIGNMLRSRSLLSQEETTVAISSTASQSTNSEIMSPSSTNSINANNPAQREMPVLSHATCSSITLEELAEAIPYYAHYLTNVVSENVCTDESVLCRNVIRGCQKYGIWKSTYLGEPLVVDSLDEKTLRQISAYLKEFVIPLFQLWTMKHSTGSSILNLLINEGFRNNWYGLPSLDPFVMRSMLDVSIRDAINIGKKFKEKFSPTTSALVPRIEHSIISSESSLTATISHCQSTSESFTSGSRQVAPQLRVRNMFEEPPLNNQNINLRKEQRANASVPVERPLQTEVSVRFPTTVATTIDQQDNQITAPHAWNNKDMGNGIVAIQSTVVQNTAVVLPMPSNQYAGANAHFLSIASIPQIAPQSTTAREYTLNSTITSNPCSYSQSTFQQYPQQVNQYPISTYSNVQPSGSSSMSQEVTSNTSAVLPQIQPPALWKGMQTHQVTTTPMPVVQRQPYIGPIQRHSTPVQPNRMVATQQRSPSMQVANAPNRQFVNRPLQQNATQRLPIPHQHKIASRPPIPNQANVVQPFHQHPASTAQQQMYTCAYCRGEALQKCSGCPSTFYCSPSCQVTHWEEHRIVCSARR